MNKPYNTIFVNGEAFNCVDSMSLYDLLIYLGFDLTQIIVEHNSRIIPNSQFNYTLINDDDQLEVITVVGGG